MSVFPGYAPPPAFVQQPMAPPPVFAPPPAFAQQSAPPTTWIPQAMPAAPPPPTALAHGPVQPRTVVRGQMPDPPVEAPAPRPAPLTMPSPEQLGLGAAWTGARDEQPDWNAALQQAHRLGATDFHLSRLPAGACAVSLLLPTGQAGTTQRVEATAATEAAAVRLALQRAEQWATQK